MNLMSFLPLQYLMGSQGLLLWWALMAASPVAPGTVLRSSTASFPLLPGVSGPLQPPCCGAFAWTPFPRWTFLHLNLRQSLSAQHLAASVMLSTRAQSLRAPIQAPGGWWSDDLKVYTRLPSSSSSCNSSPWPKCWNSQCFHFFL